MSLTPGNVHERNNVCEFSFISAKIR